MLVGQLVQWTGARDKVHKGKIIRLWTWRFYTSDHSSHKTSKAMAEVKPVGSRFARDVAVSQLEPITD